MDRKVRFELSDADKNYDKNYESKTNKYGDENILKILIMKLIILEHFLIF